MSEASWKTTFRNSSSFMPALITSGLIVSYLQVVLSSVNYINRLISKPIPTYPSSRKDSKTMVSMEIGMGS